MTIEYTRREFLAFGSLTLVSRALPAALARPAWWSESAAFTLETEEEQHLLYVAEPGIRNYVEWGGIGVLVYDIADGFRLVRRIATLTTPSGESPEPIKGICASAATGKLYVSTPRRLLCIHLRTDALLWSH